MSNKYTNQELLKILYGVYCEQGQVKYTDFKANYGLPSGATYIKRFGSWNNAMKLANIPINQKKIRGYSEEILINKFKEIVDFLGRIPTFNEVTNDKNFVSAGTVINYFDTYDNLVLACGFKHNTTNNGKYKKNFLISEIQRFVEEFKRVPVQSDFEKLEGYPSRKTFTNHFGSFNKVIKLAGFEPLTESKVEIGVKYKSPEYRQFLLNELKRYVKEFGHIPTTGDFENDDDFPNRNNYRHVFGNWNNALREAELPLNSVSQYEDSFLESEFRRFVKEHGRIPTYAEFNNSEYPSFWYYQHRFGSWNNAVIAYGYEPNDSNRKYYMEDGEVCCSSYEHIISTWLKERNIRYDRNIPYIEIDQFGYKGKMDCDYKIYYNNKIWFVEMAGFLGGTDFSKYSSQEKNYFFKLIYKKKLLKRSKVNYIIIEPCDIKNKTFEEVFIKMLSN